MNELKELFPWLGIPIALITLFKVISTLNPITTATASSIEKRIMSKENRFYHSSINYFIHVLIYSFFLSYLTYSLFQLDNDSTINFIQQHLNPQVEYGGIILLVLILLFFISSLLAGSSKKIRSRLKNYKLGRVIIVVFIFTLHISASYFLYSVISLSYDDFNQVEAYLAAIIFILFSSLTVITPVSRSAIQFIHAKEEAFFIMLNNTKWYIYHPINKSTLLLGNHREQIQSTKSYLVSTSDLHNQIIHHDNLSPIQVDK